MSPIIVTGAAGFIGYHVTRRLLALGHEVHGVDNLNDYYAVSLKQKRIECLSASGAFHFHPVDIADRVGLAQVFDRAAAARAVHLAAQTGVRHSLKNPYPYAETNLAGFTNVLEMCRQHRIGHLVYASSSSVYGANPRLPMAVHHAVDHPLTLYSATKRANELMAHSYSHQFDLPTTGLRFFSVYGPWGRPDMVMNIFMRAMLEGRPIDIYHQGRIERDFVYVDDVVTRLLQVLDRLPASDGPTSPAVGTGPYRVYNVGNNRPISLLRVVEVLEAILQVKAQRNLLPMAPGDIPATCADIEDWTRDFGPMPMASFEASTTHCVEWFRDYYRM